MGPFRIIAAPIRGIGRSRLFQLAIVLAVILLLDRYSFDYAALRQIADGLKRLVDATVQLCSDLFRVGVLTDPVLQVGIMITYVYLFCLLILFALRIVTRFFIDLAGWTNFLWLRNAIARERGIAAYHAWIPLERIRPKAIPQDKWEQTFAWPADNKPPYPPLARRIVYLAASYVIVFAVIVILLQVFTPFPALSWFGKLTKMLAGQ